MKTLVFEKTATTPGKPKGAFVTYTYKNATPDIARIRAWAALKRDHPGENRADWTEVPS